MASQQKPYVSLELGANEFGYVCGDISAEVRPQIRNAPVVMNARAALVGRSEPAAAKSWSVQKNEER